MHANLHGTCAHACELLSLSNEPIYEMKNFCFLVDQNCRLSFKEDSLREGEWVCHEYNWTMNFVIH